MSQSLTTASLAAAAALAAIAASAVGTPAMAAHNRAKLVHCYGVNTCKGQSDCKTASNECKGQNSCKGHGFKEMTPRQCRAARGSLTPLA